MYEQNLEPPKQPSYQTTDMGNGERFAYQHQRQARYCPEWETWLVWTGAYWEKDGVLLIERLAKQTIRSIYHEASDEQDDGKRQVLIRHGLKSE